MTNRHNSFSWLFAGLLLAGLVTYAIPWLANPGVSLSLGAYDLAEWSSLHPQVRSASPPLLTSFLLRLPLLCLAVIAAFTTPVSFRSHQWWFATAFVGAVIVTLAPPPEFFTDFRNDPNYQQQFALMIVALPGGLLGLSGFNLLRPVATRRIVVAIAAVVGAAASMLAINRAYHLMLGFELPTQIGWGGVGMVIVFGAILIHALLIGNQTG